MYTHHQRTVLFSVGQMISPEHWDDAGMVKRTMRGYSNINALIEKKKRVIDDIRIELQLADIDPTIYKVKDAYQRKYKKGVYEVKVSPYILDHWDAFVDYQVKIKKIADGTA